MRRRRKQSESEKRTFSRQVISSRTLGIIRHKWTVSSQSFISTKWFSYHSFLHSRLLDMRAFGGAIASSCSDNTEYRRSTPAIFELNPFWHAVVGLLFNFDKVFKDTLWETARITLCLQMACTVVISMQKLDVSIVFCSYADRRAIVRDNDLR